MAVRSGREFLQGLRDSREVWLEGERVEDVTTHPKLRRMAATLAHIYDLQHDPNTRDLMSFDSPTSGDPISLSYMIPESVDDLVRRRGAFEVTARESFGMLGRTPDYCNIIVTAMRQMADVYGENDPQYTKNVINYYDYVSENDLCLTHTFGHPQANRSVDISQLADPYLALGVVDTTSEGVIVRGAKLLATLAPFSDEILAPIYRPLRPDLPGSSKYAIGFAIPVATPGLKFVCRESYDLGHSSFDYPLSGRFDEMDCMAIFDDVLLPWDRVFAFDDVELGNKNLGRVLVWRQYMQQVAVKNIARILGEFRVGGGMVQEATGRVVKTLKMPLTAKVFLLGMAMAMMTLVVASILHFVFAADISSTTASLEDAEQRFIVLEGVRRVGVAMFLFSVLLGLATIVQVLRFQSARMRELVAEPRRE